MPLKPGDERYYHRKDEELRNILYTLLKSDKIDLFLLNVVPLTMRFRIISEGGWTVDISL